MNEQQWTELQITYNIARYNSSVIVTVRTFQAQNTFKMAMPNPTQCRIMEEPSSLVSVSGGGRSRASFTEATS